MSKLHFPENEQHWDGDSFAMVFASYDDDKPVVCLISGEALLEHFGAMFPVRETMEVAFVSNRAAIEEKARELYDAGVTDKQGRVLVRSADFRAPVTLAGTHG